MTNPVVSVVVPTFQRRDHALRLVAELLAFDLGAPYEIVVVDDCSNDGTADELRRLHGAPSGHSALRVIRHSSNRGAAAVRNTGWQTAAAPLVAFIDDDCRAAPGWLPALVGAAEDADVVQGRTLPDPAQAELRGPFSHTIVVDGPSDHFETCNIAYRRDVLEALGGFDESYPATLVGEDVDLGWRAREAGYRITYAPDALVYHEVTRSDFLARLRRSDRRAGLALLYKQHPQLRRELSMRAFSHPAALAILATAAVGATGGRRRWTWVVTAALMARFARMTMHTLHPPRRQRDWAAVIPLNLAANFYDIQVMARASVTYRTFVL